MIPVSICFIAVLVMVPVMLFVNVFCAVMDYRIQKIEMVTAKMTGMIGVELLPYRGSVSLSHTAAFGLSGLMVLIWLQIHGKVPTFNPAYIFFVCYVVIMPTFEILTRTAARWKEPEIRFKKYLWMKH